MTELARDTVFRGKLTQLNAGCQFKKTIRLLAKVSANNINE